MNKKDVKPLYHQHKDMIMPYLVHSSDENVNLVLVVSRVTTLVERVDDGLESSGGSRELEGPQEVVDVLEVGSDGVDLVDDVLNADNSVLLQVGLDDGVVEYGDSLSLDLGESTLVYKLLNGLQVGVTVGDVGLDESEHVLGGLVELNEGGVSGLEETEELEHLSGLGVHLGDTSDTDNNGKLGLGGDVEVTLALGGSLVGDEGSLDVSVGRDVLLGSGESNGLGGGLLLASSVDLLLQTLLSLRGSSSSAENGLWYWDIGLVGRGRGRHD